MADAPRAPRDAVLRYWLAMVRQEEALQAALKVGTPKASGPPELLRPRTGHAYMKLVPEGDDAASRAASRTAILQHFVHAGGPLVYPVVGERVAFLEDTLAKAYRRERAARFGQDGGETPVHFVGFPTLHAARRQTLATVLRFPIASPTFLDAAGKPWKPPSYNARRHAKALTAPTHVRIPGPLDAADAGLLPYTLDAQQLGQTLGVLDDDVERLLARLSAEKRVSPAAMIAAVTALIDAPTGEYPTTAIETALGGSADTRDPDHLLAALVGAVEARLPADAGVRVYPVGICWDGSLMATTRGLQQDLTALIDAAIPNRPTPLERYLGAAPAAVHPGLHIGLRGPHGLTSDQRVVADAALGGPLTAASGPPGTGKTELILNLAADALIRAVVRLAPGGGDAPLAPMVVTSTNNRAVDNVLDPLSRDLPPSRLPLGLRVGSMAVQAEVTLPLLERTRDWLDQAAARTPPDAAGPRWESLAAEVGKRRRHLEAARKRSRLSAAARDELPALEARLDTIAAAMRALEAEAGGRDTAALSELDDVLRDLRALAHGVSVVAQQVPEMATTQVLKLWKVYTGKRLERLAAALTAAGVPFTVPPPPLSASSPRAAFDALAEALQAAAASPALGLGPELLALHPPGIASPAELVAERDRVLEAIAEFHALDASPVADSTDPDAAERALFDLACEAREAWAVANAPELNEMLSDLIEVLKDEAHLFRARLEDDDSDTSLFALFPVVGCTLLSLGNTFPFQRGRIDLAVIDEAGQCHPAYAVSALGRARRALVIGDVHQLEPVVGIDTREEARVLTRHAFFELGSADAARAALQPWRSAAEAGNSAQRLASLGMERPLALHDHFRCQPEIIALSDRLCDYGLRVRTRPASLGHRSSLLAGPILFHDVRGPQTPAAGSWSNEAEVDHVAHLVRALLRDGLSPAQLAVLTPYRGQLGLLHARFRAERVPLDGDDLDLANAPTLFDDAPAGGLALGTVHRFQGGERDVVIFSTVIAEPRSLPFLNDRVNLVNVAVSRARQHLLVVGNADVLSRGRMTKVLCPPKR
jgi:hypothetical protein